MTQTLASLQVHGSGAAMADLVQFDGDCVGINGAPREDGVAEALADAHLYLSEIIVDWAEVFGVPEDDRAAWGPLFAQGARTVQAPSR